jgi:hypothetical protein
MQLDTKVLFRVPSEDGSYEVETLWATHVGGDDYKLDNSPFFAYGVSWEDVVHAPVDPEEGRPIFQHVVSKSGNRTIRVVFDPPVEVGNESDRVLKELVALGCSYEGANSAYISINIPSGVALKKVLRYLIEQDVEWEHGDPTYESLFPGS